MSNFLTLSQVSGGLPGSAPRLFTGSSNDNLAAITTAGYVADKVALGSLNINDLIWMNYDIDGTPGYGSFIVTNTSVGSLVAYANSGTTTGTAAAKAASDNTKASLASVSGATVANNIALFNDTAGTVKDGGIALAALQTVASIKAGLSPVWGGGGTSHAFTITGLTTSSIVVPHIITQANAGNITAYTVTANTLTCTFSVDPGAGTQVAYIAFAAAQ